MTRYFIFLVIVAVVKFFICRMFLDGAKDFNKEKLRTTTSLFMLANIVDLMFIWLVIIEPLKSDAAATTYWVLYGYCIFLFAWFVSKAVELERKLS